MARNEEITRHGEFDPDDVVVVGVPPDVTPIAVVEADPAWPSVYAALARLITDALGDRVIELDHVGSTSVAGLAAKPVIDIDLTVADSSDETAYVPSLEAIGFELRIRERSWHEHRCMTSGDPAANLHVWSPGSPEVIRHGMFRDWLRQHPEDRALYAESKLACAVTSTLAGEDVMAYNQRKQPVIHDILDRMFRAHGML